MRHLPLQAETRTNTSESEFEFDLVGSKLDLIKKISMPLSALFSSEADFSSGLAETSVVRRPHILLISALSSI